MLLSFDNEVRQAPHDVLLATHTAQCDKFKAMRTDLELLITVLGRSDVVRNRHMGSARLKRVGFWLLDVPLTDMVAGADGNSPWRNMAAGHTEHTSGCKLGLGQ